MRKRFDPETQETLLEALLQDEDWLSANACLKEQALGAFHARLRLLRSVRWAASVAVLAIITAGMWHWFGQSSTVPQRMSLARSAIPKAFGKPIQLTDSELVAAFPKGSCFIAEVDGRKELIFLDPQVEHTFVALRR